MFVKNLIGKTVFILIALAFALPLNIFGQDNSYKILTVPDTITKVDFYPFGGYLISGEKSADFSDFYSFSREDTKNKAAAQNLKIVGAVMTSENGKNNVFRMEDVSLTNKTLNFRTETVDGVRYELNGTYTKKGDLRRFYKNQTAVLRGKLSKFSNNESVFSADVVFYFKVWKAESYYRPTQ